MITLINSNNSNYKSPQYQIQIGSTDQQIYTIAARTFNSDKSFWRKVAIFFGSERKFIPIKIGNNTIETVYVKIQDIQKNLGIKPQEISKVENFDEYNFNELIKNKYSEKHRVSADKSFANSAKIQRQISSSPKQIVTPKKKQSTNSAKTQVKGLPQKFKNRLKELQFKEIDEQNLIHAGKRINFSAMINLLEKEKSPEKKQRLMNTFIAIGKTIEIADNSFGDKGLRVKRDKLNDTHAFTIIDNRVFIELSKLNINDKSVLLGKGAFKSVTKAYEIIKDSRQKPKLVARVVTTEDDGELENREKVSRAKNVVKAHICRVFSSSKKSKDIIKTVTFEQLYTTGDALLNIKMPLKDKISALIGVGTGIAEIHKLGYVHMDIKIDNCLLERRKNGYDGNIADLGMLQQKNKPIIGGTVSYLPPEAIKIDTEGQEIEILPKGIADPKIDSYSFGMTILAAITNDSEPKIYPPIIDENGDTIPVPMGIVQTPADYTKVMTAYMNEKNKEFNAANNPEHVAKKAILNVCAKLMTFDPKNRISCEEATKELLAIQTRY